MDLVRSTRHDDAIEDQRREFRHTRRGNHRVSKAVGRTRKFVNEARPHSSSRFDDGRVVPMIDEELEQGEHRERRGREVCSDRITASLFEKCNSLRKV